MQCPKCKGVMEEATYGRNMTIDRCVECRGIWFDTGEAEKLKGKWMSDFLDSGDVKTGKVNNKITDINCPRCSVEMTHVKDMEQPHIGYEICEEHGMYFDAGEFTDYNYDTIVEKILKLIPRNQT